MEDVLVSPVAAAPGGGAGSEAHGGAAAPNGAERWPLTLARSPSRQARSGKVLRMLLEVLARAGARGLGPGGREHPPGKRI